jgi:hypothetical protein
MPHPEPIPIVWEEKGVRIEDNAPGCVKHPERYDHENIRARVKAKMPRPADASVIEDMEVVEREEEPELTLPDSPKARQKYLAELLEQNAVAEWECPKAPSVASSDPDEDEFRIPEEALTESEGGDVPPRIRKTYYDPHETRAARLRNQVVKQKLALREARLQLEEEDENERDIRRRIVSKQMQPTLKLLEAKSTVHLKDPVEERRKWEERNQADAVMPLKSAIRSAVRTDPMVGRELRVLEKVMRKNDTVHEEERVKAAAAQVKLDDRKKRKERVMKLWDPR